MNRNSWRSILRFWIRDKRALIGIIILLFAVFFAIFAPQLAPYDPMSQKFVSLEAPSNKHWLGTDDIGRDLLSRIIFGARISLFVGVVTVAISLVVGVTVGLLAGYYGGWIDMILMRYIDLQWAFPNIIIAVGLVALFGTGLWNVIAAITLAYLDDFARITRGQVLVLREEDFTAAAKAQGASDARILYRHLLPNLVAPIIVQASISVAAAILAEAALSFLGLGVSLSTPSWGLILNGARGYFSLAWWLGIFPGLAIMLVVLAINFVGDGLRDFLDVKDVSRV